MRSKNQCSMCPAIHTKSRSWLRSSSTREPSDPLLRVVISFQFSEIGISPSPLCVRGMVRNAPPRRGETGGNQLRGSLPGVRSGIKERRLLRAARGRHRVGRTYEAGSSPSGVLFEPSAAIYKGRTPFRRPQRRGTGTSCVPRDASISAFEGALYLRSGREGGSTGTPWGAPRRDTCVTTSSLLQERPTVMILPQVHLRKPCYDFYFL